MLKIFWPTHLQIAFDNLNPANQDQKLNYSSSNWPRGVRQVNINLKFIPRHLRGSLEGASGSLAPMCVFVQSNSLTTFWPQITLDRLTETYLQQTAGSHLTLRLQWPPQTLPSSYTIGLRLRPKAQPRCLPVQSDNDFTGAALWRKVPCIGNWTGGLFIRNHLKLSTTDWRDVYNKQIY